MLNRLLHRLLLAVLILMGAGMNYVQAAVYNGTCGATGNEANVTWSLNTTTHILSISGTGAMADYTSSATTPWYSYRTSIWYVSIKNTVTNIGNFAFSKCSNLLSVSTGNGVTSIGTSAFLDCSSLNQVTFGSGLKTIGPGAFNQCSHLTSLTIPNGVTSIGYRAFQGCSALTSVSLPNSLTSIAGEAFRMCSGLISVTIPNSVTSVGNEAFYGCSSLVLLTISNSVTTINTSTFEGCSNLSTVTIPSGVTVINQNAFKSCSSLTSVTIPNSVTSIKGAAFEGCSALVSVTIPSSVISIGSSAFEGCSALVSVTIPTSVTSIEYYAFRDCSNLTDIHVSWITSSTIPVWYYMTNKSGITLHVPCGTQSLYANKAGWTTYTIVGEDPLVGTCGASGNEANVTWTIFCDSTLTISGTGAMANFTSGGAPWYPYVSYIASIVIEDGVTSIGNYAFRYCSVLKSVSIPSSVTTIGNYAFISCYKLSSITLPNSVTSIGTCAFGNNASLTSITIPNGVTAISSSTFQQCTALASVTIPNSVTSIGNHAFNQCSSLTSITIPHGVTSIGNYAFSSCSSLTSVTIPSSVTSIGTQAFYSDPLLTDIYVSWTENIPAWPTNMTNKTPQTDITLHVPCAAIDSFEVATGWKDYTLETEYTASGTCGASGDNLTWTLNACDSTLIISGTGAMANYPALNMPWKYFITSITSVIISDGVTTIGSSAFQGCSNLRSLTVPPSLTSVGQNAFSSCWAMESVYISDLTAWCNINFGTYDSSPFCRNGYAIHVGGGDLYVNGAKVTTLTIPDGITEIKNDAFYGFAGITDIQFNQVTTIGNSAFNGCHGLTSVTLPEGVTSIGQYGICYCSHLQSISIPASASSLGTSMVVANQALTDIYVHWTENVPAWPDNFTNKTPQSAITLHVPCSAIDEYQDADGWKDYTIEGEGQYTVTVQTNTGDDSMGDVSVTINP